PTLIVYAKGPQRGRHQARTTFTRGWRFLSFPTSTTSASCPIARSAWRMRPAFDRSMTSVSPVLIARLTCALFWLAVRCANILSSLVGVCMYSLTPPVYTAQPLSETIFHVASSLVAAASFLQPFQIRLVCPVSCCLLPHLVLLVRRGCIRHESQPILRRGVGCGRGERLNRVQLLLPPSRSE